MCTRVVAVGIMGRKKGWLAVYMRWLRLLARQKRRKRIDKRDCGLASIFSVSSEKISVEESSVLFSVQEYSLDESKKKTNYCALILYFTFPYLLIIPIGETGGILFICELEFLQ